MLIAIYGRFWHGADCTRMNFVVIDSDKDTDTHISSIESVLIQSGTKDGSNATPTIYQSINLAERLIRIDGGGMRQLRMPFVPAERIRKWSLPTQTPNPQILIDNNSTIAS